MTVSNKLQPGFHAYFESTGVGDLLHIERGAEHGGEDRSLVLGPRDWITLHALIAEKLREGEKS